MTDEQSRPKTRGDCKFGPRPCPWIGCKYHLALDVSRGQLHLSFGSEQDPLLDKMAHTCALDVADEGSHSTIEVAHLLGVSRQRVSQIESEAMAKVRQNLPNREHILGAESNLGQSESAGEGEPAADSEPSMQQDARAGYCFRKKRFVSDIDANRRCNQIWQEGGPSLRAYYCDACSGWHLTRAFAPDRKRY